MAIFNQNPLVFDERLFPPNVELMEKYGFGKRFLVEMKDQAPGPLYQFVHLPLKGITHLKAQNLRIVNLIIFYMVIGMLWVIYNKSFGRNRYDSFYLAMHLVAVTTVWQIAGLVLTEMPAIFFLTLSFYIGTIILQYAGQGDNTKIFWLSILMGITGGLAVLGRTPYLVMLAAFFAILFFQKYFRKDPFSVPVAFAPYAIVVLAMIVPIFIIWGGLAPPLQPLVDGAIKLRQAFLAFAYAGVLGLLINYKWFLFNRSIFYILIATFVIFLILNFIGSGFEYAPMSATFQKVFGKSETLLMIYTKIISSLLASAGAYFLICCYYRGLQNLDNKMYLFAMLAALAILASTAKISHQFSSRYVAQAAPFLVLMFANIDQEDKWKWARFIVAMVMGILSLNTYAKIF
jgi:hypothetical protein